MHGIFFLKPYGAKRFFSQSLSTRDRHACVRWNTYPAPLLLLCLLFINDGSSTHIIITRQLCHLYYFLLHLYVFHYIFVFCKNKNVIVKKINQSTYFVAATTDDDGACETR
jgi:hypothetical protein